jgi:hypothetical protein
MDRSPDGRLGTLCTRSPQAGRSKAPLAPPRYQLKTTLVRSNGQNYTLLRPTVAALAEPGPFAIGVDYFKATNTTIGNPTNDPMMASSWANIRETLLVFPIPSTAPLSTSHARSPGKNSATAFTMATKDAAGDGGHFDSRCFSAVLVGAFSDIQTRSICMVMAEQTGHQRRDCMRSGIFDVVLSYPKGPTTPWRANAVGDDLSEERRLATSAALQRPN